MRYRDILGRVNTTIRECGATIKRNQVRTERRARMATRAIMHDNLSSRAERRMSRLINR